MDYRYASGKDAVRWYCVHDVIFMIFEALLQVFGALMAFREDGVLAKLLGLLFCLSAGFCVAVAIVFIIHDKRKGNEP